jgi:flagellar biosynthesis/type III secretory pathway chaperone
MTTRTVQNMNGDGQPPAEAAIDASRLADRLDHVLGQLEELYASLEKLSAGQAALIDADDAPKLLTVLSDRQAIIAKLQQAHEEFAPFEKRWNELLDAAEPTRREEFAQRIDAMALVIETIANRDEADRSALSARRVQVAERLGEVTKNRSAISAYGSANATRTTPRFQNREG